MDGEARIGKTVAETHVLAETGGLDLSADLAIRRRADLVSTTLDDAIMFMSVSQGNYYMLEGTGRAIWELIDGSRGVAEMVEILCRDYDITPERCEAEVRAFLEELERNGMLETGA